MKKSHLISRYQTLLLVVFVSLVSGCSVPKVAQEQTITPLPEQLALPTTPTDSVSSSYTPVNVASYFKDPNLTALLEKAFVKNPDYLIMQERVQIANSHLKVAKMALLPSVALVADASGTHYADYTMEGVGNYDTNLSQNISPDQRIDTRVTPNYFLGGRVSWEADIWGKLSQQKKAALQRYFGTESGMRLLQANLLTDIAQLYYKLIALDKKSAIYKENLKTQKQALDIISAQRSVGKATELAVQQFEAQNNNILAEARQLDLSINQTEKALLTLLGDYEGEIHRSTDFLTGSLAVLNQKINVDTIIHNRPDVQTSYFEFSATQADAKSARAAFFPTLRLDAYAGLNSFSLPTFFNAGSIAWQLLGGLTAPVFNKGQIKQQFLVSTKKQQIAYYHYQNSVTTAFNELSALLYQTAAYKDVLAYKKNEIDHLEIAVNVSNDLYLSGYANYLEIISAQKYKLQAELDYITLQLSNANAQVQLYKALGGV